MGRTALHSQEMKDDELPCLDMLEATPAILRGLMTGVPALTR